MKKAAKLILPIAVACVCAVAIYNGYPKLDQEKQQITLSAVSDGEDVFNIDGVMCRRVVDWDFSKGVYPGSWGWGQWEIAGGLLRGENRDGTSSVYFFPFTHGGNVVLSTKVRFIEGANNHEAEAQLLTRDSEKLNYESGLAITADEEGAAVRHMAKMKDYIYEIVPTSISVTYGKWYIMRFMIHHGHVRAYLNGIKIYSSGSETSTSAFARGHVKEAGGLPVGTYHEPHLTVINGVAEFKYVRIYVSNE